MRNFRVKNKIKQLIPPIFVSMRRDLIDFIKLNRNTERFDYKKKIINFFSDKDLQINDTFSEIFTLCGIDVNTSLKRQIRKQLTIYFDDFKKKDIIYSKYALILNIKKHDLEFFEERASIYKYCFLIICTNFEDINKLNNLNIKNTMYLPLYDDEESDFDEIFNNNFNNKQSYFLLRTLLYLEIINYKKFYDLTKSLVKIKKSKICITLPETISRRDNFKLNKDYKNYLFFPAIKIKTGWIGCALSYKTLSLYCLESNFTNFAICEDDSIFRETYYENIDKIMDIVKTYNIDLANCCYTDVCINIFSKNNFAYKYKDLYLVKVYRTTGAVFNIYSRQFLQLISKFKLRKIDYYNYRKSQMDQYTYRHSISYNVFAVTPNLVEHDLKLQSSINDCSNSDLLYNYSILKTDIGINYLAKNICKISEIK